MKVNEIVNARSAKQNERAAVVKDLNNLYITAQERELTSDEQKELNNLKLRNESLLGEIADLNSQYDCAVREAHEEPKDKNQIMREFLKKSQDVSVAMRGTTQKTNMAEIAPLTIQDLMQPLADNLIVYDKVGLKAQDSPNGTVQWPYVATIMATVANEDAGLTDTTVDLDKVTATPVRIGITASVTNQAINSSDRDVVALVSEQIRRGLKRALDRATLAGSNFNSNFHGPAASALTTGTFAATVPTYKELLAMKGAVAKSGANLETFCYVMSPELFSILEATPINANGGDRMIIENKTIAGYPVYLSNEVDMVESNGTWAADSVHHVLAGCWEYIALCVHGTPRMIVDPISQAKKDKVEVTLNVDMSLTNLRTDSNSKYVTFARYKCHA